MFDSDVFPFHNGPQRPRTVPGFLLLQTYGSGRFCPVRSIGKVSKIRPSISSIDRARFESETTFKKHTLVLRCPLDFTVQQPVERISPLRMIQGKRMQRHL